ncbi:TrkA C-terminal domain-containing protein [Nocardioides sp. R-C-SC26]|uniref:TrkA C-terminal domain-containing protein n=1 Tax=Nocardioides sp. R-C-SC26 TaxID=2870414 RepID=UPI001E60BB66|nr:TrkA C-terminal domain-containing protein [Nocardioides sp. R-C-SC26]
MTSVLSEVAAFAVGASAVVLVVVLEARRRRSLDPCAVRRFPLLWRFVGVRRVTAVEVSVPARSGLVGVAIAELRLPEPAVVALLWRRGEAIVANRSTTLQVGDRIWVVMPSSVRNQVDDRLRDVAARGRLARWYSGLPASAPTVAVDLDQDLDSGPGGLGGRGGLGGLGGRGHAA